MGEPGCRVRAGLAWHTRNVRPRLPLTIALAALTSLAACGSDGEPTSSAERFCGEAIAHQNAINDPPVGDETGLQATLDFYRLMGDLAPISIAEEWNQLIVNLETAASFDPLDPDSEQEVVAMAYATEPAAYAVYDWLQRNCGLTISITTIAPHELAPSATLPGAPPATSTPPTTVSTAVTAPPASGG